MKKILILTDSINVNAGSGPKANIAIIENLIHCGYNVTVIHNTRDEVEFDFNQFKIKVRWWSLIYWIGVFTRILYRKTKININKWIEPAFGFSAEFFSTSKSFTRELKKHYKNYDLVMTLSIGASFRPHYAALKYPRVYRKWLAYIHDPYPFHYYPRPYNWVQPGFKQKEEFFYQMSLNARWFAFPSQLLMEWMGSYFPEMEKKGILIPHQISGIKPQKFDTSNYWNPLDFNILHAGSLMKQRPANGLIRGFLLFLEKNPEAAKYAKLHLIGPADYHKEKLKEYSSYVNQLKVNLDGVPFRQAYWLQREAAVNIILESKSEISPFLPGKFSHCVEALNPILLLSPHYSETKRLLGINYPYWCEQNDEEKIAEIISILYTKWKNGTNEKLKIEQYLKDYLSPIYLKQCLEKITKV